MWYAAAGVIVVLAVIWASYTVGKRYGKVEQRKEDAEGKAEDMAHDAEIAARPNVGAPFSGMRPKD